MLSAGGGAHSPLARPGSVRQDTVWMGNVPLTRLEGSQIASHVSVIKRQHTHTCQQQTVRKAQRPA